MIDRLARLLVQRRLFFTSLSILALVYMAYGMRYLHFNSDHKIFFGPDNPQLIAHEHNEEVYSKSDNVTFVLELKDNQVFARNNLKSILTLTDKAWQMPYSGRVNSITNYQHTWVEDDDLIVEDLVTDPDALSDEQLQKLQNIAVSEPELVDFLISAKADTTAVSVDLNLPENADQSTAAKTEVVDFARKLSHEIEAANPNVKIHLIGQTMVNNTFNEMSRQDISLLIPIMFIIILFLLQAILKTAAGTFSTLLIIVASSVLTEGFMGWAGYAINQVNVGVPIIIMTIAVCDCVHILNTYLYNRGNGSERLEAMVESLRANIQPIFLTSITTAIGFLSMNFSDSPPFRDLGTITGFGVMCAFALSLCLFPALVLSLPMKPKQENQENTRKLMARLSGFAVNQPAWLFWGLFATALVLTGFMFKNDLNDDTVKYFDKNVPFRQAADFTQEHLTGFHAIGYSLNSGETNGVTNPDFLQKVEAFTRWYKNQPEAVHVSSITNIMKRLNQNMHQDDSSWYRLPDNRELAAQYLLLYEMSLPFGLDLNNRINVDKSSTLVRVRVRNQNSSQLINLDKRAQAWFRDHAPELQVHGASTSIMFAHIGQRNINSMLTGSVVALVLVTVTLLLALGSWKYGMISLLPNAFPAVMSFGLWGIFVGEVNVAVAVIFAITLGIVVDDTVHFLTKYLKARRKYGYSAEEAIHYAYQVVGRAIITTTIVLSSGFFVLAFSDFAVNSSMGLMVAITILIALVWDLLFLPGVILRIDKKKLDSIVVSEAVSGTS